MCKLNNTMFIYDRNISWKKNTVEIALNIII